MNDWLLVILFSSVGSALSLVGGLYLLYSKSKGQLIQKFAVPFAAGALLAASFMDLIPEALHESGEGVLPWVLGGFLTFFTLERFLRWFHHHHEHEANQDQANRMLIVFGDTIHNFIDGLAIGAAFLISPVTGIITTLAVAVHEIPQEIGDFGLLISKGMSRKRILIVNAVSALATVVAAVSIFAFGNAFELPVGEMLAVTAGFFIYIAASDVVPTIHQKEDMRLANVETIVLLISVIAVSVTTIQLHSLIDADRASTSQVAEPHL